MKSINSLSDKLKSETDKIITDVIGVLNKSGENMVETAKDFCPVDEGNLKASIHHVVKQPEPDIIELDVLANATRNGVQYGRFVEYGTGLYNPNGRDTPWRYQDKNGKWHTTRGQAAQPFMRPALAMNIQSLNEELHEIFKKK